MREWHEFHRPAFRDWRWLETSWFGFFVPEHGIRGHLRCAFRTNQEVVYTMAAIYSRGGGVLDMDLFDAQMHVPLSATDRYSDFSLPSGFSFRGHPAPNTYSVRFKSRCGRVDADLEYEAMMDPAGLDITTIIDGPPGFAAFHRDNGLGVPTGHMDQTLKVRGTLRIDGDVYDVNCVSNRDQSWSPRGEFKSTCGTFDTFHFGEEMSFSTQAVEHVFGKPQVTHAYLLLGTEVRRVRRADVEYVRDGYVTKSIRYDVEDEKGDRYEITAEAPYAITQDQGSNGITVMNYCIPQWNGKTGYGECMWHWDIPKMQGIARAARKTNPDLTITEIFDQLARKA